MQLSLGLLADAANRAEGGKLNLLGVFGTIGASAVPVQHPQMCVVLNLRASPGERGGAHSLKIVLVDQDGVYLGPPIEVALSVPADTPVPNPELSLIFNLVGVVFPKFGTYEFDVLINGNSIGRIPLEVRPVALPELPSPRPVD
ncbi:MAG: DUF6941 family protein [Chloroflexia bacterium]